MAKPVTPTSRYYSFGLFATLFALNAVVIIWNLVQTGPVGVDKIYGVAVGSSAHLWRVVAMFTLFGTAANIHAALGDHGIQRFTSAFNYWTVLFYLVEAFYWTAVRPEPFVGMIVVMLFLEKGGL